MESYLERFIEHFGPSNPVTTGHLVSSVVLLLILSFVRLGFLRGLATLKFSNPELRRKWRVQIKNLTTVIFFLGLAVIWATELESVAISLVAVAAAVAISFKEYNLCLLGGLFKASAQLFTVGDRIEIDGVRGDVIDHNFLTTTLLEIGPGLKMHQFTGRRLIVPNSLFLSHTLVNETMSSGYGLHSFEYPVMIDDKLTEIHDKLLEAATEVCAPYVVPCQLTYRKLAQSEAVEEPTVAPRVTKYFPEPGYLIFVIRVPVLLKKRGSIEQEILHRMMLSISQ